MKEMEFNLNEIYIQSIMTKTATIIVEGVEDVPVYDAICNRLDKNYDVIAIENIEEYSEGSDNVIDAMDIVMEMDHSQHNPNNYIVGVIDKDVRDYRNEIPKNNLIFMLNQYSVESHFVSSNVLPGVLPRAIKATTNLMENDLDSFIYGKIQETINQLYLYSLEALKGALDPSYQSCFSYSYKYGRIKDIVIREKISQKEHELIEFGSEIGVKSCIQDLKKISKGKWLLNHFCQTLEAILKKLTDDCANERIIKCQFCINQAIEKCQYKLRDGVNHISIREFTLDQVEISELDYVRERFNNMLPDPLGTCTK